ncbi:MULTISPECIES: TetR/AcrR family transcriptional regulator [unclassified Nocardioides]|uniref:TetR/AcrR family transcriptional regulator n=1 Tax=unclassified Nocardioides TaxID=2615069 RepID=UPI00114EB823|nr:MULTISPECIES: TetR/AcrR family transcriptional regulator [unclassified Nocardioides]TQK72348.1 TetR family transcriptional regulator [Nocardioides sp. SLBN-35]WGY03444.1 TetR/AcrR family transcriptional regulator [Nocardioides sp. QY071]
MPATARDRLVAAAFELFAGQGYDATTVEEITTRAGTGRSTFFRHFPTKDDVVLPDHEALLRRVDERLATASAAGHEVALREAAGMVLEHYLAEGETARTRYRLASSVPAIRDREIASVQRYVRLFGKHVHRWLDAEADGPLRAELVASAVVIAHNHVLRQWLRGAVDDAATTRALVDRSLDHALALLRGPAAAGSPTIVITSGGRDVEQVVRDVRDALGGS